jgi:hypothetical protein
MLTLNDKWTELSKSLFDGTNASQEQIADMRLAFFSGAFSLLQLQKEGVDNSLDEDAGTALLGTLADECSTVLITELNSRVMADAIRHT